MKKTESETIIIFNMEENEASIDTHIKSVKTQLRKLGVSLDTGKDGLASGRFSKSWIKIGPPREVSKKQRLLASKRMKKRHGAKNKSKRRKN